MQAAVIADIHGNASSLRAVLKEIDQKGIDQIICLGDIVATGPEPLASLELIRDLDCPVVMGNTDDWVLNPEIEADVDESIERIQEIDTWCADQLSASDKDFIESFDDTISMDLGENMEIYCFHGSPRSFNDRIEATTDESELDEFFEHTESQVLAGAHTHIQLFRRYFDSIIVNPGSIGLPHQQIGDDQIQNPPWAEWAIINVDGAVDIELRRTPVDVSAIIASAENSGMPHADYWIDGWAT